jgi:hypothetical protein
MARWSEVELGESIGPMEFRLSDKLHRRYIDSAHNELAEHADVIDPSVAANFSIFVLGSKYPGPIIHTHQELRYYAPVTVGETVTATGTVSIKEMRRDKAYVAIDCDFLREDERVWWARMTCIWPEVHLRGEA